MAGLENDTFCCESEVVKLLTGKQRGYLRGLGAKLTPILQVGKSGISDQVIIQLEDALVARELIKVRVLPNCSQGVEEVASLLSEHAEAEIIQVIGRNMVLYKQGDQPKILIPGMDVKAKGPGSEKNRK